MAKAWLLIWASLGLTLSHEGYARERPVPVPEPVPVEGAPPCMSGDREIGVNNVQVLAWKNSTPNQYKDRARVKGEVVDVFKDTKEHRHFEIRIGNEQDDVIEIVYNQHFGEIEDVQVGMIAEACGDYITSNAPTDRYQASPSGAIVHWVHMNPKQRGHAHGYLVLDGMLFGQDYKGRGGREEIRPRPPRPRYFTEDFFEVFF